MDDDLDGRILVALGIAKEPLCVDTISYLLNIPTYKACKRLKKLAKYHAAKRITKVTVNYWSV